MPPTHLRFDSDDDTATPAGTIQPAPATTPLHCISTVRTDFNSNDRCYVLQLAFAPGSSTDVAAACSNNLVKLYSINESQVVHVRDCIGHTSTLTSLTFLQPHLLATSSYDGTVRTWDARNGQQVAKFAADHHALFSCSAGGDHHLAAGADGKVLFWDVRTTKQLVAFADTHAGEVTQVLFHPTHPKLVISGSVDGLIAVHDVSVGPLDEDEGFCAALNLDTSVALMGLYGGDDGSGGGSNHLWCTSGTEGLHLWEIMDACSEDGTGGCGVAAESTDARQDLSALQCLTPTVDYLINSQWDHHTSTLLLAAGTANGAMALFPVGQHAPLLTTPAVATCAAGPHDAVVRAVQLVPGAPGRVVTGGEDSRVCVWSAQGPAGGAGGGGSGRVARRTTMRGGGNRVSPY